MALCAAAGVKSTTDESITSCVRIADGRLAVTNQIQWAETPIAWADDIPPCCVNGKQLRSFVKLIGDQPVSATVLKNAALELTAGDIKATLPTLPVDDFPGLQHAPEKPNLCFSSAGMDRVIAACDGSTPQYALRGVFASGGRLEATNGHKASRCAADRTPEDGAIIPKPFAMFLTQSGGEKITCSTTRSVITWRGEDGSIVSSKLIDGTFPILDNIWPKDIKNTTVFSHADLISAMNSMALGDGFFLMRCMGSTAIFTSSDGEALIRHETTFSGDDVIASFNRRYFSEMLFSHKDSPEIIMQSAAEHGPFLFCGDELIASTRR